MLMVPMPAIIFNQIAFPLQLFASRFGAAVMELAQVPVLREGNVIVLAHTTLEVAEACSGIRSLISLLTLGIVYGYFTDPADGSGSSSRWRPSPSRSSPTALASPAPACWLTTTARRRLTASSIRFRAGSSSSWLSS